MKKKITVSLLVLLVLWYTALSIILLIQPSSEHTDALCLSVKNVVREIQEHTNSPDEAWCYLVRNNYQTIGIDDEYYFKLDVILCDDEWYITAVPSVHERFLSGAFKRFVFLDFVKVFYPIVLGSADDGQQFLEDPESVLIYKSTVNKCEGLDHLDFGTKYFYR